MFAFNLFSRGSSKKKSSKEIDEDQNRQDETVAEISKKSLAQFKNELNDALHKEDYKKAHELQIQMNEISKKNESSHETEKNLAQKRKIIRIELWFQNEINCTSLALKILPVSSQPTCTSLADIVSNFHISHPKATLN